MGSVSIERKSKGSDSIDSWNDSVRTRLTHSYEVSNLARSIGFNRV